MAHLPDSDGGGSGFVSGQQWFIYLFDKQQVGLALALPCLLRRPHLPARWLSRSPKAAEALTLQQNTRASCVLLFTRHPVAVGKPALKLCCTRSLLP